MVFRASVALSEQNQTGQNIALPRQEFTEVGIGRDQYSIILSRGFQDITVASAAQPEFSNMDDVRSGTCRSLTASAANCKDARTSSAVNWG